MITRVQNQIENPIQQMPKLWQRQRILGGDRFLLRKVWM
jgi:hypothetical protein